MWLSFYFFKKSNKKLTPISCQQIITFAQFFLRSRSFMLKLFFSRFRWLKWHTCTRWHPSKYSQIETVVLWVTIENTFKYYLFSFMLQNITAAYYSVCCLVWAIVYICEVYGRRSTGFSLSIFIIICDYLIQLYML